MASIPDSIDIPSLKALGKRRLVEPDAAAPAAPQPSLLPTALNKAKASDDGGKRVTRSSLGGDPGKLLGGAKDDGLPPPLFLPNSTPIFLTVIKPPNLTYHPPPDPTAAQETTSASNPSTSALPTAATAVPPSEVPQFRLLGLEDSFTRSRHGGPSDQQQVDTSDAHYARLHRFPEVLEKRSARLERDRLIHERSKLILEIEEMRGRGWVYQGMQGGKGEEIRRRRLKEGEERLKRYDALLPNQPRKSGMLNLGSHITAPADSSLTKSRSNSPLLTTAPPRKSETVRHSTPLSASGDGSTTIRIKFGAAGAIKASAPPPRFSGRGPSRGGSHRAVYGEDEEDDEEDDEDEDGEESESDMDVDEESRMPLTTSTSYKPHKPKRDRPAERNRAAERIRLNLPPRVSLDKAALGGGVRKKSHHKLSSHAKGLKSRRGSGNPEMDRDSAESNGEAYGDEDSEDEEQYEAERSHRPSRHTLAPSVMSTNPIDLSKRAVSPTAIAAARRLRLADSFFHSAALRDAVALASTRRSSSRVSYAFGTRLPDTALARQYEFEPRGGNEDGVNLETSPNIEELVRRRLGKGEHRIAGVRVPTSAMEVLEKGPLQWSPTIVDAQSLPTTIAVPPAQNPGPATPSALFCPAPPPKSPPPPTPLKPTTILYAAPPPAFDVPSTPAIIVRQYASPPSRPPRTDAEKTSSPLPIPPAVHAVAFAEPTHGHGTRNGSGGTKRTVLSLTSRGTYEVKVRIDG